MKTLDTLLIGAVLLGGVAGITWSLAAADPLVISGPARVIDGDTVMVAGLHVRLRGVDASERGTPLADNATAVIIGIVGDSELTCRLTGEKTWRREVGYRFTTRRRHQSGHHRTGRGAGVPAL